MQKALEYADELDLDFKLHPHLAAIVHVPARLREFLSQILLVETFEQVNLDLRGEPNVVDYIRMAL